MTPKHQKQEFINAATKHRGCEFDIKTRQGNLGITVEGLNAADTNDPVAALRGMFEGWSGRFDTMRAEFTDMADYMELCGNHIYATDKENTSWLPPVPNF